MVTYYNFSQTFISALVEIKLVELCENKGMELLIAPTSLLACEDTKGFYDNFIVGAGVKAWRNYFATSLLIRIPSYHSRSSSLTKIYFMTRNKTIDNCIVVPSGFIVAAKDSNSYSAVNEGYRHYDIDYGIDVASYINASQSVTDPLIEDLTTKIADYLFIIILKYYI